MSNQNSEYQVAMCSYLSLAPQLVLQHVQTAGRWFQLFLLVGVRVHRNHGGRRHVRFDLDGLMYRGYVYTSRSHPVEAHEFE